MEQDIYGEFDWNRKWLILVVGIYHVSRQAERLQYHFDYAYAVFEYFQAIS